MTSLIVLITSVVISGWVTIVSGTNSTLRLVNLAYRHGDRTPVTTYPNNPIPASTWVDGLGRLTKKGEKQHYSLGRFLRRQYAGFLSSQYTGTEIVVESSDVDRCLMSAYSNLAGLYPPSVGYMFNKNISWQPIPVHTRPEEEDNMLALRKPCAKYDQLRQRVLKSDRVVQIEADNKAFLDFVSEKAGVSLNIENIFTVSDTVYCQKVHNLTLPSWVNDTTFEKLLDLEAIGFEVKYSEKEESRLKGGPILKEWLRLAQQKMNKDSYTIKMNMFSVHDTTVVALLGALGLYNGQIPPYTTTVIMELQQHSLGDYYVELYLRNVTSEDPDDDTQPHPLTLPGCDFRCPYHQFVSLTSEAVPVDWEAECAVETPRQEKYESTDFKRAFIITTAVYNVAVLSLILVVVVMCFRRSRTGKSGMI